MTDYIIVAVIVVIVGAAVAYIIREKKRGAKCIGCPDGTTCGGNCSGCGGSCGCGTDKNEDEKEI